MVNLDEYVTIRQAAKPLGDNSDDDWKVQRNLHDWCQLSKAIDVATGYFKE